MITTNTYDPYTHDRNSHNYDTSHSLFIKDPNAPMACRICTAAGAKLYEPCENATMIKTPFIRPQPPQHPEDEWKIAILKTLAAYGPQWTVPSDSSMQHMLDTLARAIRAEVRAEVDQFFKINVPTLTGQIMNIQIDPRLYKTVESSDASINLAYKLGHRDARHAAAELIVATNLNTQTSTTGHCAEKKKPGGCQLHNLQCGYPQCDKKEHI